MAKNDDGNDDGNPGEEQEPFLFDLSEYSQPPVPEEVPEPEFEPEIPQLDEEIARQIYCLAEGVRRLKPWEELAEDDWFGITHPETGEIMVVSIMGLEEQNFAVQLYLQGEGINFWNRLLDHGEIDINQMKYDLRMVECEFLPKRQLGEYDLRDHKRFAPRGAPRKGRVKPVDQRIEATAFRSYRPAYVPWQIDNDEARLIGMALRLTPRFIRVLETEDDDFYGDETGNQRPTIPLFTLRPDGDESSPDDWELSSCPFPDAVIEPLPAAPVDEFFIKRFSDYAVREGSPAWECVTLLTPDHVEHAGRLAFATVTLTLTSGGHCPPPVIGNPDDCPVSLAKRSFAAAVEAEEHLPERVLVQSPTIQATLGPLAAAYGIEIELTDHLPELERFVAALAENSASESGPDTIPEFPEDLPPELIDEFLDGISDLIPPELRQMLDEHLPGTLPDPFSPPPGVKPGKRHARRGPGTYRVPTSARRYVMRIDLRGAKPPIWRRISLPTDASMFDLHCAIQDAMGWMDDHLHEFELRKGSKTVARVAWDPDASEALAFSFRHLAETLPELGTTLGDLVRRGYKNFYYTYDFGDSWEHKITIENELSPEEAGTPGPLPQLLKGKGACPPEDCGGIWAYQAMLSGEFDTESYSPAELEALRSREFDPTDVKFQPAGDLVELHQDRNMPF